MSQFQIHDGDRITRRAGVTEPAEREVKQVGALLGFVANQGDAGDLQVVLTRGQSLTAQVVAAETIPLGTPLYWHEFEQVCSIRESDAFLGWAARDAIEDTSGLAKKAGETTVSVILASARRAARFLEVLDFAAVGAPAAQGSYTLRDYLTETGAPGQVLSPIYLTHDGLLAPGAAVIEIGTVADPDAFLVATDLTTILAGGVAGEEVSYALPAAATVLPADEIVLTITVADITAGKLRIRMENSAF